MNAERLIEARGMSGFTQKELADKAGVSVTAIAGYEAGGSARKTTIYRIAAALFTEVNWLCSEEPLIKRLPDGTTEMDLFLPPDLSEWVEKAADKLNISAEEFIVNTIREQYKDKD